MDTRARKQLLLTRIALERAEWTREVEELQRAGNPRHLLSSALRAAVGPAWLAGLFGRSAHRPGRTGEQGLAGRLVQGWLMLRRHPVWWPVLASALPWVRKRARLGRLMLWLPLGAGVAVAVWVMLDKRRSLPSDTE